MGAVLGVLFIVVGLLGLLFNGEHTAALALVVLGVVLLGVNE